jgi:hypothetical protein
MLMGVSTGISTHSKHWMSLGGVLNWPIVTVGLVVGSTTLVSINSGGAISLIVGNSSSVRAVDGDLVVVGTQSVSVGVGVREDSALEHLVIGELNTWDNMGWGEGNLFNLGEVILRVSVKIEFSNRDQRIVAVRDYLGHIEDVKLVVLTFLLRDELDIPCPWGEVTLLNVLEQILLRKVLICGWHCSWFFGGKILDALVSFEVIFDIMNFALLVNPLVSVRAVSIQVSIAIRSTAIREEDSNLMKSISGVSPEVPNHVGISKVSLRISLLRMQKVRELNRILNKEHRGVISNHIVVALLSVELNSESSGISNAISRSSFTCNSWESQEQRGSLSDRIQELSLSKFSNIVSHLEVAVSTGSLGVDDSLGDSLSVKLGELVNQVEVLEEDGSSGASGDRVLVVVDRHASACCQSFSFHLIS